MERNQVLLEVLKAINAGKIDAISAERLLNAETRRSSGVPTGVPAEMQRPNWMRENDIH